MKTRRFLLAVLAMLLPLVAAEAEEYKNIEINGLFFNLKYVAGKFQEAAITKKTSGYYYGDISIPSCVNYKEVNYSVTSIDVGAFQNCIDLTSVAIPNSVTGINGDTFEGCSGLTSVTIGNSVTYIGGGAFYGCSSLASVTIPNSVTSIGSGAFYGCRSLTSVTIPNSVTSIGNEAFSGCYSLTSVTIPESVTSIGVGTFYGCSGLTSVTIPESGMFIGDMAFSYCRSLTSVTIPNSVTSIGNEAFSGCSSLTSVNISNSVTYIGSRAFYGCSGLTSVHISDLSAWCNIVFWGSDSNPLTYAHHLFIEGNEVFNLTVPSNVTSIGGCAFYGCSGLTSVTIPNSVTSIGSCAFSQCSGLTSVTIPNSVTSIDGSAFRNCSSLTSVTIPNSVTSIGSEAFRSCSSLTSVGCLCCPTSVSSNIFSDCTNIQEVTFDCEKVTPLLRGNKANAKITMTDKVTSIGDMAFFGCSGLTSVTIPDSVTSIGAYAFSDCSGLTFVTIGNNVTSIDVGAFQDCIGLTSVAIPNSVAGICSKAFSGCSKLSKLKLGKSINIIQSGAFANCESLADVTCLAKSVPSTSTDVFSNSYIEYATLHVYESSIDEYKAKSPWGSFKSIVAADIPMFTLTYIVDGAAYIMVKYEEGDKITPEAAPTKEGYTFSGWSEIPKTMPANDVTITGTFTINKYKLIYKVDGVEYKSYDVEYGATITPEPAPNKEGYDFSGWDNVPETMPAHDVTVNGSLTVGITNILRNSGEVKIFDVKSNQIGKVQKGINILVYKDGKTKKIMMK